MADNLGTVAGMDTIIDQLHANLTARAIPGDVAKHAVDLGAEEWLDGQNARLISGLARGARTSMPREYARHPGLVKAYESAHTLVQKVADASEAPDLGYTADPLDPGSLNEWIFEALSFLGLDADAQPRVHRFGSRVKEITYEYPVYGPRESSEEELDVKPDDVDDLLWELTRERTATWGPTGEVEKHTYRVARRPNGARGDKLGHADFRTRLNAAELDDLLPGVSKKLYRKAVRAVLHLQQRTEVLARRRDLESSVDFGKARLAGTISRGDLQDAPRTAVFVAYYVARLGLRTAFTSGRQARPMDELGEALLEAALVEEKWDVLAKVLTRQKILRHLTAEQTTDLAAEYHRVLEAAARSLESAFDPNRERAQMVVRRGDDSTTWNMASRAFNQARTGLLNLRKAAQQDDATDNFPGKVPALIAADVNHWHEVEGDSGYPDLKVWAELPLPWDVVLHAKSCTFKDLEAACARHGVDPAAEGWTAPYRQAQLEETHDAVDMVHGVAVSGDAQQIKKTGAYSGQA